MKILRSVGGITFTQIVASGRAPKRGRNTRDAWLSHANYGDVSPGGIQDFTRNWIVVWFSVLKNGDGFFYWTTGYGTGTAGQIASAGFVEDGWNAHLSPTGAVWYGEAFNYVFRPALTNKSPFAPYP